MPELKEPLPLQDLQGLLEQTLGSPINVQVNDWRHLTDPGENFGSLILAVNVNVEKNGKRENLNLVCKMPPTSDYLLDLFNSPVTFKKELYFYSTIAPAYLQFQLNSGIPENELIELVPRFYGGRMGLSGGSSAEDFDSQAAIILENLVYAGYKTEDRIEGMGIEQMKYGVRELAKLHAITCGYRDKDPKGFETTVAPGLVQAANAAALDCLMKWIGRTLDDLKTISEAQPIMDRIQKTVDLFGQSIRENKPKIEHWTTFLHNDFWVNNMMYRYSNNGQINGMKMVDFQLTLCDYGIKDLIFFLVSSAKKDVIDEKINDLINLYYQTFVDTLRSLKVDTSKYSREQFDSLVAECAPLKLFQCLMMCSVIKATKGSAPDVKDVTNEEEFLSIPKSQAYRDKLLHTVQTFSKNGWLVD